MSTLSGKKIGKYQIETKLGTGGMAEVYKGYQENLDRYVAIKFMHPFLVSEQDFLSRFQREARAMANLSHPNIVRVYDFDVYEDSYYLVMEYINGGTLKEHLQERASNGDPMPMENAVRIITQVADALAYAHRRNMIHRDIKPANIMLDKETGKAILTDFGIVKLMGDQSVNYTATGALIGTPAYMSPEQALGQAGDARVDIYSLGVLLFQMITNQLPFDADTPLAVVMKHVNEPAPLPMTFNPDIPLDLQEVTLKALAKNPDDRYQTAGELATALRHVNLSKVGGVVPPTTPIAASAASDTTGTAPGKTTVSPPATEPEPETAVVEPPLEEEKKKRPIWLFALIGVIALILIGGGLFASGVLGGNTPATPTQETNIAIVEEEEETDTPTPTATEEEEPAEEDVPTTTPNALATQVAILSANATQDAQPTDTPTPSRTPTATPDATLEFLSVCETGAELVSVAQEGRNSTAVLVNQTFDAQWVLENSGSCPWPEELLWTFVEGESFGYEGDGIPIETSLLAGEQITLTTEFTAPSLSNTYESVWQLVDAEDEEFAEPMSFEFTVFPRATATPLPTNTPAATATPEAGEGQVNYSQTIGNCTYPGGGTEWRCEVVITPYIDGNPTLQGQYTLFVFDQPAGQATVQRGNGPFYYFATARRCAVFNQGIRIVDDVTATEISAPLYVDPDVWIPGGCTLP